MSATRGLMAMVMLVASSRVAWAAPGEERPLRVEIDVSAIAEADAPHIARFTNERIEPLLRERAFTKVDEAGDAVEIRIEYLDPEDLEYAIYLDVYNDGTRIDPGIPWFVCKFCPQGMVADKVAENLPAALDLLERSEAAADAESEEATDPTSEPAANPGGEPPPKPVRPIGWLGITGAVAAGGGLATTIAGAVRLAQGEVVISTGKEEALAIDYRPQGVALIGVGATVVVLGTAAVVVDVLLRKKKRRSMALVPSLSPDSASMAFSTRF